MDYFDEFTYEAKPKLPSLRFDFVIFLEMILLKIVKYFTYY
jgi:hypothetical protein